MPKAKILEQFKKILPPERLERNERLKPTVNAALKPPIDSPRLRARQEEIDQAETARKKMEKLIRRSPVGLELLVIDGEVAPAEIESIPGLNDSYRERLLKVAELHEKIKILKMRETDSRHENLELRREIERLKKSAS